MVVEHAWYAPWRQHTKLPNGYGMGGGGEGKGGMGGGFVRILSMLIYITHQQKFAVLYVWISCNALEVFSSQSESFILSLKIGF